MPNNASIVSVDVHSEATAGTLLILDDTILTKLPKEGTDHSYSL